MRKVVATASAWTRHSVTTLFSIKTLLEFRDITLARAEEEVGRELVLRIPISETLKVQLAERASTAVATVDPPQPVKSATPDSQQAAASLRATVQEKPGTSLPRVRRELAGGLYV